MAPTHDIHRTGAVAGDSRSGPPVMEPNRHGSHAMGHSGHGWMMLVCCIPMLAIAVALVATGTVSAGFLLVALACPAMMFVMMRGMHGGNH